MGNYPFNDEIRIFAWRHSICTIALQRISQRCRHQHANIGLHGLILKHLHTKSVHVFHIRRFYAAEMITAGTNKQCKCSYGKSTYKFHNSRSQGLTFTACLTSARSFSASLAASGLIFFWRITSSKQNMADVYSFERSR